MARKLNRPRLIVFCCLLCVAMLLVGCGTQTQDESVSGDTQSSEPVESTAPEEAEPTPAPEPAGSITVWGWEQIKTATDTAMPDFQAEYPDIEVNFEVIPAQDLYQKLILAFSAGGEGAPDVVTVESSNLAQMVESGQLCDLTDNVQPYLDRMNEFKWCEATKDDKIYAMPWDSGPVALYYRRDIFEAAGYPSEPAELTEVLKTWDDFYQVAVDIKDKTGAYMISESKEQNSARTFEKLLWQQGTLYFDAEGNPDMASPEAVRTLEFLGKLVKGDLVDNTIEWTQPWYDSMNIDGNVATHIDAVWMAGFMKSWIAADASGKWGVIPLPVWEEGGSRTSNDGGSNFAIPLATENFDAAWAYVEYMLGREDSQLAMYEACDIFPALETTYDADIFYTEMEYFGGQKVNQLFAELVKEIPDAKYTKNYPLAKEVMENTILEYFLTDITAVEALEDANAEVTDRMAN